MTNQIAKWQKKQRHLQKKQLMGMKRVANDMKEIVDFADSVTTVIREKDDEYYEETDYR